MHAKTKFYTLHTDSITDEYNMIVRSHSDFGHSLFVDQLMWNFVTGFRIANHVIARPVVNNAGACTRACQSFGVCGSINFRSTDNRCELNHVNGYVSTDIVADPKWKYGWPVFFLSTVRSSPPNRWQQLWIFLLSLSSLWFGRDVWTDVWTVCLDRAPNISVNKVLGMTLTH